MINCDQSSCPGAVDLWQHRPQTVAEFSKTRINQYSCQKNTKAFYFPKQLNNIWFVYCFYLIPYFLLNFSWLKEILFETFTFYFEINKRLKNKNLFDRSTILIYSIEKSDFSYRKIVGVKNPPNLNTFCTPYMSN